MQDLEVEVTMFTTDIYNGFNQFLLEYKKNQFREDISPVVHLKSAPKTIFLVNLRNMFLQYSVCNIQGILCLINN